MPITLHIPLQLGYRFHPDAHLLNDPNLPSRLQLQIKQPIWQAVADLITAAVDAGLVPIYFDEGVDSGAMIMTINPGWRVADAIRALARERECRERDAAMAYLHAALAAGLFDPAAHKVQKVMELDDEQLAALFQDVPSGLQNLGFTLLHETVKGSKLWQCQAGKFWEFNHRPVRTSGSLQSLAKDLAERIQCWPLVEVEVIEQTPRGGARVRFLATAEVPGGREEYFEPSTKTDHKTVWVPLSAVVMDGDKAFAPPDLINKKLEEAHNSSAMSRKKGYRWKACWGQRAVDAEAILSMMQRNAAVVLKAKLKASA